MYIVFEQIGNFSKIVYKSEYFEECQDYILDQCEKATLEIAGDEDLVDYEEEMINQISYFNIEEIK